MTIHAMILNMMMNNRIALVTTTIEIESIITIIITITIITIDLIKTNMNRSKVHITMCSLLTILTLFNILHSTMNNA